MPIGLAILGWTNKEGFFIIDKYPEFEISEEDAMSIGSTHRMRNLKPNTITLSLKNFNVASFFSGLRDYYVVPNIAISLILNKDEDPQQFVNKIHLGVKDILSGLSGIGLIDYGDRTVNIDRVLEAIQGNDSYKQAMPALFGALSFGSIQENPEELLKIVPPEEEEEVDLDTLQMDLDGKQQGLELAQQAMKNLKNEADKLKNEILILQAEKEVQSQTISNLESYADDQNLPITSQIGDSSLFRLMEGIRLYWKYQGSALVLSGGSYRDSTTVADVMVRTALEFGVPEEDMILEKESKDTKDEAQVLQAIVGTDPFLLVTSASHMPRSVMMFRKLGMQPIPAPTGHLVSKGGKITPVTFFPGVGNLMRSERAIYEYLGITWAKLRGQI